MATNGCFDILHAGHVMYLQKARGLGDALVVGLNSDSSVRQIKGPDRPINCQEDRLTVLAALECVDAIVVYDEPTAERFLAVAMPDVYVKGGDYEPSTLNQREREIVERNGGRIVIIPPLPGRSTTALARKIAAL